MSKIKIARLPGGCRKVWGDQISAKHQNVVNIITLHTDKDLKHRIDTYRIFEEKNTGFQSISFISLKRKLLFRIDKIEKQQNARRQKIFYLFVNRELVKNGKIAPGSFRI